MSKMIYSNNTNPYEINDKLLNFVKDWEGLKDGNLKKIGLQPYLCPANIWTCGYGHVCKHGNIILTFANCTADSVLLDKFTFLTELEAVDLLKKDLKIFIQNVTSRLTVDVLEHQFEMLVSHAFNCGYSQTLYALINSGQQTSYIANWIKTHYIRGGGKILKGLVCRRMAEASVFKNGW